MPCHMRLVHALDHLPARVCTVYVNGTVYVRCGQLDDPLSVVILMSLTQGLARPHPREAVHRLGHRLGADRLLVLVLVLGRPLPQTHVHWQNGATALLMASQGGHVEVVRLLIARGAQVDHAMPVSK